MLVVHPACLTIKAIYKWVWTWHYIFGAHKTYRALPEVSNQSLFTHLIHYTDPPPGGRGVVVSYWPYFLVHKRLYWCRAITPVSFIEHYDMPKLPCKAKRQYVLTLQVSTYCLLSFQSSMCWCSWHAIHFKPQNSNNLQSLYRLYFVTIIMKYYTLL